MGEQCELCSNVALAELCEYPGGRCMNLCGGCLLMAADAPNISEDAREEILRNVRELADLVRNE